MLVLDPFKKTIFINRKYRVMRVEGVRFFFSFFLLRFSSIIISHYSGEEHYYW